MSGYRTPVPTSDNPTPVEVAGNAVAGARHDLDLLAEQIDQIDNAPTLAGLLLSLRTLKALVAECYAETEKQLLAVMGEDKRLEVPGLGVFEAKPEKGRKAWQWDDLCRDLLPLALAERRVDEETGEVEGEGEAVLRVLRDCISFSGGKVGRKRKGTDEYVSGLRARGLQPDEYCQEAPEWSWSVALPPVDVERPE